jgi:hypothetical protein
MRMGLARARLYFKMKRKKEREKIKAEKIKESFIGKHPYTRDKNCFF